MGANPLRTENGKLNTEHPKILVIGAGMAGLAAARSLTEAGFEVQVLEGRERLGGRIWTDRSRASPVELGASWIELRKLNPLAALARQWRVPTRYTDFESVALYDYDGRRLRSDRIEETTDAFERLVLRAQTQGLPDGASVADCLARSLNGRPLDQQSRRLWQWARATQECEYGADLRDLSLNHFDEHYEMEWDDLLVVGGYDRLVERMAAGLDIRLGREVRQIEHDNDGVRVVASGETYAADVAIVTLPLGVLKAERVRFSPDLPSRKREAIGRLGMGLVDKIVLHYPRRFWPAAPHFLGYAARDGGGELAQIVNLYAGAGQNALAVHVAGDKARALEQQTDRDAAAGVQYILRTMFGDDIPEPIDVRVTRWGQDPFALGSYSYASVAATGEDHDILAEPVGARLLFAGEATHRRFPSTVHGAYFSGLREAERVKAAMPLPGTRPTRSLESCWADKPFEVRGG